MLHQHLRVQSDVLRVALKNRRYETSNLISGIKSIVPKNLKRLSSADESLNVYLDINSNLLIVVKKGSGEDEVLVVGDNDSIDKFVNELKDAAVSEIKKD